MAETEEDDGRGRNTEEISRLRGKRALALAIFIASIAFIPLGPIGCCCLGTSLSDNMGVKSVLVMAGILAPFVGLGGILLMLSDRFRYGRALALAHQADEMGLTYTYRPSRKQFGLIGDFQPFRNPTYDRADNFMKGKYRDARLTILDYSCAWGLGRFSKKVAQSVIVVRRGVRSVPHLILYPKSLLDKLGDMVGLGGATVSLKGAKDFSKRYHLRGDSELAISALFTPELVELCVEEGKLTLEVRDDDLLVYWWETYFRPDRLLDRIATARRIAKLLSKEA
jgi:hypothetical protein